MSLRLTALRSGFRAFAKPLLGNMRGVWPARVGFGICAFFLPLPFGVTVRRASGPVDWVQFDPGRGTGPKDPVLIWFHGGAYVSGSAFTHRGFLGRLARELGISVIAPAYRLAPEHPAPAAFDDAVAAIEALDLPADRLILGGDSAGGGLAAALCAHLCRQGRRPRGMVLLSPWTDLTLSGPSLVANARRDPLLPAHRMAEVVARVRGGLDAEDARISPIFADWPQACPTFLQVGSTEILLDDSLRLAAVLRAKGTHVTLERLAGAPHVLAFMAPLVPEASQALSRIGDFIRSLSPRQPSDS